MAGMPGKGLSFQNSRCCSKHRDKMFRSGGVRGGRKRRRPVPGLCSGSRLASRCFLTSGSRWVGDKGPGKPSCSLSCGSRSESTLPVGCQSAGLISLALPFPAGLRFPRVCSKPKKRSSGSRETASVPAVSTWAVSTWSRSLPQRPETAPGLPLGRNLPSPRSMFFKGSGNRARTDPSAHSPPRGCGRGAGAKDRCF